MLLSPHACCAHNVCTIALLLLLLSLIVSENRQILSHSRTTNLQWRACNLGGMQPKHARCVRAALLLKAHVTKAHVMPIFQASIYLRVPWHSIRDRSKNRGCNKPRDNVKYRRHSRPCRVQSVTLRRRRRITESGVHSESKRRIWTSCRQPMYNET